MQSLRLEIKKTAHLYADVYTRVSVLALRARSRIPKVGRRSLHGIIIINQYTRDITVVIIVWVRRANEFFNWSVLQRVL